MANTNYTGVYKTKDGYWAYRYSVMIDGQRKDIKKAKDDEGQRFKTAKVASKARAKAMAKSVFPQIPTLPRKTIGAVYQEYCEKGRAGKAYQTIRQGYRTILSWHDKSRRGRTGGESEQAVRNGGFSRRFFLHSDLRCICNFFVNNSQKENF